MSENGSAPRANSRVSGLAGTARAAAKGAEQIFQDGLGNLLDPTKVVDVARMGGGLSLALGRLVFRPPDPNTVYKGKLGVFKKAAWSDPIPLQNVKAIGKVTGGTVNDVLLTAMTGALRRYLKGRGEPVRGLNVRAVVPVNLRPVDEELEMGNKFGLVFLSLPLGIADPFERLLELKRRMDALKGTPEAVVALGLLELFGRIPTQAELLAVEIFGAKATAVMTNVPGPRQPIYLAGSQLSNIMFWVPQSGRLGLGISIMSYAGEVRLGVAVDAGLVPNPRHIIDGFHAEFDDLLQLVENVVEDPDEEPPLRPVVVRCRAITKSGAQCRNRAVDGLHFCHVHRPEPETV